MTIDRSLWINITTVDDVVDGIVYERWALPDGTEIGGADSYKQFLKFVEAEEKRMKAMG